MNVNESTDLLDEFFVSLPAIVKRIKFIAERLFEDEDDEKYHVGAGLLLNDIADDIQEINGVLLRERAELHKRAESAGDTSTT